MGRTLMDLGLFAYWCTGMAGESAARPIGETGVDGAIRRLQPLKTSG
jgi:hypothetical protein